MNLSPVFRTSQRTLATISLLGATLGGGCASIVGADFDRHAAGARAGADGGMISVDGGIVSVPVATEDFVTAYAHAMCDELARCCADNALGFDSSACLAVAQGRAQSAFVNPGKSVGLAYDATAAGECVAHTRKITQACAFTGEEADLASYACSKVYVGTKQPGEPCEEQNECASSAEGLVTCNSWTVVSTDGGTSSGKQCTLFKMPSIGDSCEYSGITHPSVVADCFTDGALRCDPTTKTCQPARQIGMTCSYNASCVEGAFCHTSVSPSVCEARRAAGQECSDYIGCGAQLYCDKTTKTCIAKRLLGASCEYSSDCVSNYCWKSKCLANNVGLPDRCGGAAMGG